MSVKVWQEWQVCDGGCGRCVKVWQCEGEYMQT